MSMKGNQLREKEDYQQYILERLIEDNGFIKRPATRFNPRLSMDEELLLNYLYDSQPDAMEKLKKTYEKDMEKTVVNYINEQILKKSRGLIDVLKNGVAFDNGTTLNLMQKTPATIYNEELNLLYRKNIFSIMEEVYHKEDERIDLVIFLNGLAIFSIELKCNTSGSTYEDAINQYKTQRDYKTRLFKFNAGVLASFAMDLKEVYMCTELKGRESFFRPFNLGSDDFGKGNPHNENDLNVSYMWDHIFKKETIISLIERFIFIEKKEKKDLDTGKRKETKTLIFPRFHQLRAVERLVDDIRKNKCEKNYLIEHSAGSGKTNTISWLAHILATLHDENSENIFDTVLIVTDRIIVDRQLQDAVRQIDYKTGFIEVMDDKRTSADLADSLRGNTKIVVTTIHKFFHTIQNQNMLGNLKHKTFAVIIDEAHSSTDGILMQSMTTVLANEDCEEKSTDELIAEEIRKSGKQDNVSIIAFTATPSGATLQLFGCLNAEGKKSYFDLYPMKQAIEEGYILDVLNNYVTYKTYFKLNKTISDDPELKSITAKKKIARFIDVHDTNIAQKVEIVIEHFRNNIASMLDGKAKAMVVTSSREAAVRYKQAFEEYITRNGYNDIQALVAFSGKISLDGEEFSETGINGFSEEALRDEFEKDEYQVLLVANKYQTGFDQPKLCAMYVDKKLKGINAVQTLSRLNRICPPYQKSSFILDFKNDYDDIRKAFEPYYRDTILFNEISISDIQDLDRTIDEYGIFSLDEASEFNDFLYQDKRSGTDKRKMWTLLDRALKRYLNLGEEVQLEARGSIRNFLKGYNFLIQATFYENIDLHKKYNFLSYLIKEINIGGEGNDFDIADKITVSSFKQQKQSENVKEEPGDFSTVTIKTPKKGQIEITQRKKLSQIIEEINSLYDKDFDTNSTTRAAMQIKDALLRNERLQASARSNDLKHFKYVFEDSVEDALVESFDQNVDFFTTLLNDKDLRRKITEVFLEEIYNQFNS
ncbi:MAG: type I restriction endonuclease subunit R [Bacteroidales bacterium]|nr:type I restriction endonuclease subunit R [Bacteroidales bacterium]